MPPARCRAASARYGAARNTGCSTAPCGCASRAHSTQSPSEGLGPSRGARRLGSCGHARGRASGATKPAGTGNRLPAKWPTCARRGVAYSAG